MGIAAAAVLFAATLVLYFTFSGISYHGRTLPPAPNVGQMPQISQPPSLQKAGAVETSFDASAYEVNCTLVFAISLSGVTITAEGWFVVGVGPSGGYSFGASTSLPLRGTAMYKSAAEGGTAYVMTCLRGHRTVDRRRWSFALIEGVNAARTAVGRCRHLSRAGTLYEERGMLRPKTRRAEDALGNCTAYICEVNGAVLSANLTATALAHGNAVYIAMKMEAVKMAPCRPDAHRLILKENKTNR